MRMGKRMKQILQVLKDYQEPLTLTDIILRIIGKEKPKDPCNKLGSALAGTLLSYDSMCITQIHGKHPLDYADDLYSLYSRSIKQLYENGYVLSTAHVKRNKRLWQINAKKPFLNV